MFSMDLSVPLADFFIASEVIMDSYRRHLKNLRAKIIDSGEAFGPLLRQEGIDPKDFDRWIAGCIPLTDTDIYLVGGLKETLERNKRGRKIF